MRLRRSFFLLGMPLLCLALSACQTGPAATSASPAAEQTRTAPTETKPAESAASSIVSAGGVRRMADNCFTCHGPRGRSPGTIPSLALLTAEQMTDALIEFKRGQRASTVMERHARGYSDEELKAIAAYIAGLKK